MVLSNTQVYDEESLSSRHVVQTVDLSNNLLHSNNSSFDKQFMSLFSWTDLHSTVTDPYSMMACPELCILPSMRETDKPKPRSIILKDVSSDNAEQRQLSFDY